MVNICVVFDQATGVACPLCGEPGAGLCDRCLHSLSYNGHGCPRCAAPLPETAPAGLWCADCQSRPPPFDRVIAPLLYLDPVDGLLAAFKYRRQLHLGQILADTCAGSIGASSRGVELLLPVPMQAGSLRERGFNQAAELARQLSQRLSIPWSPGCLIKRTGGAHQQALGRIQRQRNVRGTFECTCRLPRAVALIDDVVTTGATAGEASRMLKRAGTEYVEVWALARTPPKGWSGTGRDDRHR